MTLRPVVAAICLCIVVACTAPTTVTGTPRPTATPDIARTKLSLVYTAFVAGDVNKTSSKVALEAALDAVRAEVKAVGGTAEVATPEFQDVSDPQSADFDKFAAVVDELAAKTQSLSTERIWRAAITGMIRTSPDCHTYYVAPGLLIQSRDARPTGQARPAPPTGTVLKSPPDEAGLEARMLDGGVAWIHWTEFPVNGTYDINVQVKRVMDTALAAGAKAWLFDLRGNRGGDPSQAMASWFMNGEAALNALEREGRPTQRFAIGSLRLPDQYQLPIAIILNDTGGSSPEYFASFLREIGRATIVGQRSTGCMGAASPLHLQDDAYFSVVVVAFSGAITGTTYNNVGIEPDIRASDAEAIGVAANFLRGKIAAAH